VLAPTVLMTWSSSCSVKTTRSRDGIFAGGEEELRCGIFSSHGVVQVDGSVMSYGEFGRVVARAPRVLPALSLLHHLHRCTLHGSIHLATMAATESQRAALQKVAYESLSRYLQEHEEEVVEIEILPPAIEPPDGILMQDGLYLGVPKNILALAYVEARQRFFDNRQYGPKSTMALHATGIMLLFDPEHLTAANFRKLRLSRLHAESALCIGTAYHKALRQEFFFLDSILTSPLHRQSKSPTLWHHRFWMMDSLQAIELTNASEGQKASFLRDEIYAVFKSAEQHPKNYHAWQYARRLMNKIESSDLKQNLALRVKDWCCRHPSDISGWSFLLYMMPRLESVSSKKELARDVLHYAIRLRTEQESIWLFIRTTLGQEALYEEHQTLYQELQDYKEELGATKKHQLVLARVSGALTWLETHGSATRKT
jgi:hypothetical protein